MLAGGTGQISSGAFQVVQQGQEAKAEAKGRSGLASLEGYPPSWMVVCKAFRGRVGGDREWIIRVIRCTHLDSFTS